MSYNIAIIANYIIKNHQKFLEPLSPANLQNILYFAHGLYLSKYQKPLFNENFYAYTYGALNKNLDYAINHLHFIKSELVRLDQGADGKLLAKELFYINERETINFLNDVIDLCSKISEHKISHFIRRTDSPWYKAIINKENTVILDNEIKKYFFKNNFLKNNPFLNKIYLV